MSFFEDKNSLIYNLDNTFDNNLYLEKLFNSSFNSCNNIFDIGKMNNFLNPFYKESENNINTFGEKSFASTSGLNYKQPIKNINDELNGQFFEESTTKTLQEICIKNDDFNDLERFNSSYKNERKSKSKNKYEKATMIEDKNLIMKNKNKKGKNINNNLSFNNCALKNLSEKALKYYLKKGQGQDIDEFFNNYLKNVNDKKKNLLKIILSSNEFNSKIQKYRKQKNYTSFFSNSQIFLQKKYYLKKEDYNKNEDNSNIFNNFKTPALIKDNLKKKSVLSQKDKIINLCQNNKSDNNIKIKNNLIIDGKKENTYSYKSMALITQKDINYENIFINQFIDKYLDIKID